MCEFTLKPVSALGGGASAADVFGALRVAEGPDLALASVAARGDQTAGIRASGRSLIGADLPDVGRLAGAAEVRAFWTGPGQWMLRAPHDGDEDLATAAKAAFGDTASITEQNDAWVNFTLDGTPAPDALERLCAVDIRRMAADDATRTMIAHVGCFVICIDPARRFEILAPRSTAAFLYDALCAAARAVDAIGALRAQPLQ